MTQISNTTSFPVALCDRYKDTQAFVGPAGPELGLYQPPQETALDMSSWQKHVLAPQEVGNFDAIAVRYFGPGTEAGWFLIANANGIVCPEYATPGMVLSIPPRAVYLEFLGRRGNG